MHLPPKIHNFAETPERQPHPNNTFHVGGGHFFVETLSNYYIAPEKEASVDYFYGLGSTSAKTMVKGVADSWSSNPAKKKISELKGRRNKGIKNFKSSIGRYPSFEALLTNPGLGHDEPVFEEDMKKPGAIEVFAERKKWATEILGFDDDIKAAEAEIIPDEHLAEVTSYAKLPDTPENSLKQLDFVKNYTLHNDFDKYKSEPVTIGMNNKLLGKYAYHGMGDRPMTPKQAKDKYMDFPSSISSASMENTLFVASLIAEPSRYSTAHITNMLLLNDDSKLSDTTAPPERQESPKEIEERKKWDKPGPYITDKGVYNHMSMTQGGSDMSKDTYKEFTDAGIVDPHITKDGKPVNKNVTNRDLMSVIHNPDLKVKLEKTFDSHYKGDESKGDVTHKLADDIMDYLKIHPL